MSSVAIDSQLHKAIRFYQAAIGKKVVMAVTGVVMFGYLVGHLAGNGRRATVEEVEAFYAPYAPFRGLAGEFTLRGLHKQVAQGPPLRVAA